MTDKLYWPDFLNEQAAQLVSSSINFLVEKKMVDVVVITTENKICKPDIEKEGIGHFIDGLEGVKKLAGPKYKTIAKRLSKVLAALPTIEQMPYMLGVFVGLSCFPQTAIEGSGGFERLNEIIEKTKSIMSEGKLMKDDGMRDRLSYLMSTLVDSNILFTSGIVEVGVRTYDRGTTMLAIQPDGMPDFIKGLEAVKEFSSKGHRKIKSKLSTLMDTLPDFQSKTLFMYGALVGLSYFPKTSKAGYGGMSRLDWTIAEAKKQL